MIEFNIPADAAELERLLKMIKDSGITDAIVNVTGGKAKGTTMVPDMRLRHIARILAHHAEECPQWPALTKDRLVAAMVESGLAATTASIYVSGASGAGVIERTEHGYVLTELGRRLCDGKPDR